MVCSFPLEHVWIVWVSAAAAHQTLEGFFPVSLISSMCINPPPGWPKCQESLLIAKGRSSWEFPPLGTGRSVLHWMDWKVHSMIQNCRTAMCQHCGGTTGTREALPEECAWILDLDKGIHAEWRRAGQMGPSRCSWSQCWNWSWILFEHRQQPESSFLSQITRISQYRLH